MKNILKFILPVIVLFSGLVFPGLIYAQHIDIGFATSQCKAGTCFVNARINFDFDDEVLNALEHGVSLDIHVYLRLVQNRKWLWNKVITENTLRFELQYHPLSNNYLVTDLDSGQRQQFQTLEEALVYLGSIKNKQFAEKVELDNDKNYRGRIKAELNIESLPPPLQTAAYVSSQWQLESQWYEWIIR